MKLIDGELTYNLTYKDIVDIIRVIDDASCHTLHIELEDMKLEIVKGNSRGHASSATSALVPPAVAVKEPQEKTAAGQPSTQESGKAETKTTVSKGKSNRKKASEDKVTNGGIPVLSPLAGTFYSAPEPGAKPFVELGEKVEKGKQVGIVEVMKLMNSIKAPEDGVVTEIRVENEEAVSMSQVLMTIDPS